VNEWLAASTLGRANMARANPWVRADPRSSGSTSATTTDTEMGRGTFDRISSVCSPRSGERFTSVIESESLIGLPTDRYLPRVG